MNAIEINNLTKSFGEKSALNGINMTVPMGSIYGFIGENGSGKSTTEKIVCGLMRPDGGEVKLYGKDYTDSDVRAEVGVLIETPGCFSGLSVWNNLMLQATNLGIEDKKSAVREVLKVVRMEGAASNKFKNCSLGMKQRVGIALALLGNPKLLVLDEPINGLDADGMRIMREVLVDIVKEGERAVLISSHVLSELEKVATHYGFIKSGKIIAEMTAEQLEANCPVYLALRTADNEKTKKLLLQKYERVVGDEQNDCVRVYDVVAAEDVVTYLYKNGVTVTELKSDKISLEEYYINLLKGKEEAQ